MAPYTNVALSPAELSYLSSSLSQDPPIRPDGRSPTQFRPLVAETDILPTANGSARICFADGTEAIVGVKAEMEKSKIMGEHLSEGVRGSRSRQGADVDMDDEQDDGHGQGDESWLDVAVEIPGMREDDALPVFLAAMLTEALLASGELKDRLWVNNRFHWRLHIDILLLSQPLSYPLPLLSLTTHLALLSARLPALISQGDEDPLFNDDWEAATYLYPRDSRKRATSRPPVTLLVITLGTSILFDPSKEELAVADFVLAVSAAQDVAGKIKVLALRTVDPPSRLTAAGVPIDANATAGGGLSAAETLVLREKDAGQTVWRPPRGGVSRGLLSKIIHEVVQEGGVGQDILSALHEVKS